VDTGGGIMGLKTQTTEPDPAVQTKLKNIKKRESYPRTPEEDSKKAEA